MGGSIIEIIPMYHQNGSAREICHWITHIKLSRIIMLTSALLFIVPLFTHYYLSKVTCLNNYIEILVVTAQFEIINYSFTGGICISR